MKKMALAEKIARAEARVAETRRLIDDMEIRIAAIQQDLGGDISKARDAAFTAYYSEKCRKTNARRAFMLVDYIEDVYYIWQGDKSDLPRYKARLARQQAYLRKLIKQQSEIDAGIAEDEAYINMIINFAGAQSA